MYYIKFYKRDKMYIYFFKEKKLIFKTLTFLELYYFIRDNNINFEKIKMYGMNFDLLFYHFVAIDDLEYHYKLYTHRKFIKLKNEKKL